MKIFNFIAFDIGATSGRAILATLKDKKIELKELYRFPNKIIRINHRFYWDIYALYEALKEGLRAAAREQIDVHAVGIDTWGVDFACIAPDDTVLGLPRSYRDPYTEGIPEAYFNRISQQDVYAMTGIQIMNFNSLYQLYAAKKENNSALAAAANILFMPDALSFLLTGKKVCEYTIASTSQLINPWNKQFEPQLLEPLGLSRDLFPPIIMPGQVIGYLNETVAGETGLTGTIPVIAVAGHDTASAVAAVPAGDENFAYLSSGTWSLMGIELKEPVVTEESFRMNFTNEGGVDGTIRFLKNITGMWLLEQCRKEWEAEGVRYSYPEIVALSDSAKAFRSLIDPDNPLFAHPERMTEAIGSYCEKTGQPAPDTHAAYIRCIFDSLALKYKHVFNQLQSMAGFTINQLHIIGGGSQNSLLNQFTANATGIPVIAGPSEATAIGNALIQAKGLGIVGSLSEIREIVRHSFPPTLFHPQETGVWENAYMSYKL
ncbi:MAG: rhamnulokinase [Dysgonamonadaceae bacterium]|jgi:rhamnulokinase|nr:rhamnulokinase [Dysgonamonadaceae bacterium]